MTKVLLLAFGLVLGAATAAAPVEASQPCLTKSQRFEDGFQVGL